ncbi:hatpase c domain-containing protein [Ceratocystis lukuohia]|uniref:Hatpase c domain-containing protein n=1 Tax=Ceratocystis lukuohia TaxID=2019550 RepID=A0ABR4MM18_9PEZI
MDYSRLRAAALQGAEDEEAVTVDTRALIDKVLARYSGEWTTLRELIQNAADAQATKVTIRFETVPSISVPLPSNPTPSDILKHTITNHTLKRLVVQNDGVPFTNTDWGRLKRIAEGNPDETKIGAFGVGFYSVFADCEEPFVSSGAEAMAFYWKGNALFTKKSKLPEDQASKYTTFVLDYRNTTTPLPNALSVAQFMATSLTFVALERLEFFIDDYQLLDLHKKSSPSMSVSIPRDLVTRTKEGIMNVASVDRTSTQIDARYMAAVSWKPKATALAKVTETFGGPIAENQFIKSFFSRLTSSSSSTQKPKAVATEEASAVKKPLTDDITTVHTSTIFLRVTAAKIQTKVTASFSTELERATKKPPPKVAKLAILTSTYDETKASESSSAAKEIADVFASVLPSKKPGGRIFIGFPTMQTTGAGLHISAPSVIPTVEREAIDLNARWVRTWNIEMLRAAGIITRLSFLDDMNTLDQAFKGSLPQKVKNMSEHVAKFMPEALHILKTYSFEDSTPNSQVSQIIDESFWTSFKRPSVDLFSSRGVLPTEKIRIPNQELSRFVDDIPVVPEPMKDNEFVKKLISFGLIYGITLQDVQKALETKALDKTQLGYFLKWMAQGVLSGQIDHRNKVSLLEVAVASISDGEPAQGAIITLGAIRNFLSTNRIPAGMPLPPSTLPFAFTHSLTPIELDALGWEPLEIITWVRFLIEAAPSSPEEQNILKSAKFAVSALTVISKNWENLTNADRTLLAELLKRYPVMPTKTGMKKPTESFFPNVKVFDDLPVIQGCTSLKEKFLVSIGVRKTVDLETIFGRLLSPTAEGDKKWSHVELIRYLASVKDDIPAEDMRRLKGSRIVPAELPETDSKATSSTPTANTLHRVSELFEPVDTFRDLGFTVIQWPGNLRPGSPENRFLSALGMRTIPTVPELVSLMSSNNAALRDKAMKYYISNFAINGYSAYDLSSTSKGFLPIEGDSKTLVAPKGCFTNEAAAVMGFKILRRHLHPYAIQLGVNRDPPLIDCIKYLVQNPPRDSKQAATLFSYFAMRLNELREPFLSNLKQAHIVPVSKGRLIAPRDCYLGGSSQYSDIFDFVDFGAEANRFLYHCGAKNEPTRAELATFACDEPARLLSVLQAEKYLSLLRNFAENAGELQGDRALWKKMRSSAFLLGWQQISSGKEADDYDEDVAPMKQYKLGSSADIVIPDDFIMYRIFKTELICAPEEDILESFYSSLGCSKLRACVQEDLRIGQLAPKQEIAQRLHKHVVERSKIFLYEYTSDKRVAIRHDAKWLEKHLSVAIVQSVSLRRTLNRGRPITHAEKRSAASANTGTGCTLYVAEGGNPDMYQIGQALCQILLHKQNQQAYIFFEPFLTLDLLGLKQRGYNVDRILRAKAAEARIAEQERQQALEREQERIRERAEEWKKSQQQQQQQLQALGDATPRGPQMPGGFDDDTGDNNPFPHQPETQQPQQPLAERKSRGLFSTLSRHLGFEQNSDDEDSSRSNKQVSASPSPRPTNTGDSSSGKTNIENMPGGPDEGKALNPAALQQNLLNAVRSTRAHGSNQLQTPAWAGNIQEQTTYCDSGSGHDLTIAAESSKGMKVYMDRKISSDTVSKILATHNSAINTFADLLLDIAGVYTLSAQVMHIYYDQSGPTIAFNLNGSIFFNLRYFLQLHWADIQPGCDMLKKNEVVFWWWVVLAHELSHNLIKQHGASHTYYTQAFIQQYHSALMAKLAQASAQSQIQPSTQARVQAQAQAQLGESLPPPPAYTPTPTAQRAPTSLLD